MTSTVEGLADAFKATVPLRMKLSLMADRGIAGLVRAGLRPEITHIHGASEPVILAGMPGNTEICNRDCFGQT